MQKKTIKPDMLAKFKAGEIYVDPQGDLEGIKCFLSIVFPKDKSAPEYLDHRMRFLTANGDFWLATNNPFNHTIIPLSEMYETVEDEFVMGEEVEVSDHGVTWFKDKYYLCPVPVNTECQEKGYKHIVTNSGYPGFYRYCRRPIRKQTVTLEDLIATYAEKHGIAPEVITVDNN